MSTKEDLKKAEDETDDRDDAIESDESSAPATDDAKAEIRTAETELRERTDDEPDARESEEAGAPVQLGYMRFVYAAYMAGAMLVGFLVAKSAHVGWYRLGQYKPQFGEPRDEVIYPVAGVVGILVALYYWRKAESRQYANEVAEELSKVTWPSRKEVTNSTFVVILTTLFATVFFALMDQFWRYVTDKIYSFQ